MSTESAVTDGRATEARTGLDAWVREIIEWHFNPDTGCPFWLDWAQQAGWDPRKEVGGFDDLCKLPHFEDEWLYMLYPPDPRTEAATMREGQLCLREEITINMFLIPSWSQSEEDNRFAHRLAEGTQGRVFFTAGRDLDRFVLWDYVQRKKEIIG